MNIDNNDILSFNEDCSEWINNFPYDKPRNQQKKAINKVLNAFKKGKKFAIIECGTGVGKSAIGLTIAKSLSNSQYPSKYIDGSYFLTTQKVLQEQYEKDFKSKGMTSLKSASNYPCKKTKGMNCKEVQTLLRSSAKKSGCDAQCKYDCTYKTAKKKFIEYDNSITNFSYFLTERNYNGKIPPKKVLIIDEAHNLENELSRFIEISISSIFSKRILNLQIPKEVNTQYKAFNWIKNVYIPKLISKTKYMEETIDKLGMSARIDQFTKLSKQLDLLKSHRDKICQFLDLYDKDNWVFDIEKEEKKSKLVFKPIDVSHYSGKYLLNYADYVIFMSATIISHEGFMKTIGIDKEKTVCIKEDSPFPIENRPIIYSPSGSMSIKSIDHTLPVMKDMIKEIMQQHANEKGIIHTHSIKIAKYLKENIKSDRLIIAYGDNREKSLEFHKSTNKNTILLTPSMSEGVDLKGNLSSFQILCKMPYPYLGDKVVRKKINKWDWWYNTQTVRTIIQSIGRSIRNEKDVAVTYILDRDWLRIKSKCYNYFPNNFFENYHEY